MLRIKIELVPYGKEDLTRQIGSVIISNDGTGTHTVGNYKYTLSDETGSIKGELKEFKRVKGNAFHLLRDVLDKALL